MVTLDDVAAAAGVSKSTVSRVLNGRDTLIPVSAETRQRIFEAARQLRYRPNLFACSLKSKRSHVIGIVMRDFTYPFWSGFLKGISAGCSARLPRRLEQYHEPGRRAGGGRDACRAVRR